MQQAEPSVKVISTDWSSVSIFQVAAVAMLGPLMTGLDGTVVNLSLSTIQHELHSSLAAVQWIVSGYLLALALALPLNGWLVDRIGAKRLYIWCFSAFTLASLLCGHASTIETLICARVLQGIAGGLITPMTQMMIARVAGKRMATVMGYTAVPIILAPLLGPVLAGAILKYASWPWLFYINLPVGVIAVCLAALLLPSDSGASQKRNFDFVGFLLVSPGLVAFLYGLDHYSSQLGMLSIAVGVLLLVAFILYAGRNAGTALINVKLFEIETFSTSAGTLFLNTGASFAGGLMLPLYLTTGCHVAPASAGLYLAAMGVGMLFSYPLVGKLTDKFGPRMVACTGTFLLTLGTLPMLWMAQNQFLSALFVVCLFARGVGQGGIGIPTVSCGYASISKDDLSQATTASNIVQRVGGPVATTLMAIVMSVSGSPALHQGDGRMFIVPFCFLIGLQVLMFCSAMRLPQRIHQT